MNTTPSQATRRSASDDAQQHELTAICHQCLATYEGVWAKALANYDREVADMIAQFKRDNAELAAEIAAEQARREPPLVCTDYLPAEHRPVEVPVEYLGGDGGNAPVCDDEARESVFAFAGRVCGALGNAIYLLIWGP